MQENCKFYYEQLLLKTDDASSSFYLRIPSFIPEVFTSLIIPASSFLWCAFEDYIVNREYLTNAHIHKIDHRKLISNVKIMKHCSIFQVIVHTFYRACKNKKLHISSIEI